MSRIAIAIVFVVLLATVGPSRAQMPAAPAGHLNAMAKLSFLVGNWHGGGTMEPVPGQRHAFTSSEEVRLYVDGLVMTIEGVHYARVPGDGPGPKVHHAFATVRYDAERGDYAILATRLDGNTVTARGRFEDGSFIWGFEDGAFGHLRYTIRLSPDGRWTEVGERSPNGVTWTRYFEMTLARG